MSNDLQLVFQLNKKGLRLIDWGKNNHCPIRSKRGIARALGISHATLLANMEKEQMSEANQLALAKAFGFSVEWIEWRDPDASRQDKRAERPDSADAFMRRFISEKANAAALTIVPGDPCSHLDRRFADCAVNVFGSSAPDDPTQLIAIGVELAFDRRGLSVLLDEFESILTVGLRQADLQLLFEREGAKIDVSPLMQSNDSTGNFSGKVEGLFSWWVIERTTDELPWLAGTRLANGRPDCICRGFQAGDIIRAILTARVSHCVVEVEGKIFEGLCAAKILLIKHLVKLSVLRHGEAILCEQNLTVATRSSAPTPRFLRSA